MNQKFPALAMILISALGGCASSDGADDGSANSEQALSSASSSVRLVYAKSEQSGCSSCISSFGVVEVDNVAPSKAVDVVYSLGDNVWHTAPATYFASPTSTRDLFSFSLSGANPQFAIRYRVAGTESWDNAKGPNYIVGVPSGESVTNPHSALGVGRDIAVTSARECSRGELDRLCVESLVRNLSATKSVRIVYTTDEWATTKVVDSSFVRGPAAVRQPRGRGSEIEQWRASLPGMLAADTVSFAVAVEQDGKTVWDNAYDANFRCVKRQSRLLQDWKCSGGELVPRN